MKKIFSFALVALTLASCKNTEDVSQQLLLGVKNEVKMSISADVFNSTRASDQSIDNLYIYVFQANDVAGNSVCEFVKEFNSMTDQPNLSKNGSVYEYKMEITQGGKYILVSANTKLNSNQGDGVIKEGTTTLSQVLENVQNVNKSGSDNKAADLSGSFPMIGYRYYFVKDGSSNDGNTNIQESETCPVALERLWSKVDVTFSDAFQSAAQDVSNSNELPKIEYTMRNISKEYKYTNLDIVVPSGGANGVIGSSNKQIFPKVTNQYTYWMDYSAGYKIISKNEGSAVTYVPENTVKKNSAGDKPTMNSVTYAQVCLTANPAKVYGTSNSVQDYSPTTHKRIYLAYKEGSIYKEGGKVKWYSDSIAALNDVPGCHPYGYNGGKMYYRVDLKDDARTQLSNNTGFTAADKYCVVRNSYYKITLSGIRSFDQSLPAMNPGDLDGVGDQVLGAPTLFVDITVKPWVVITQTPTL